MADIIGSGVMGVDTTVDITRAIALGVDGATNVHSTSGVVKIFGNLEVTGTTTSGNASVSDRLDALGT